MKIFKNIEKFKYVICDGKCNKCLHYCNPNSNIDNNKELIEEPLLNEILIKRSYECNGLCSACKKKNCDVTTANSPILIDFFQVKCAILSWGQNLRILI